MKNARQNIEDTVTSLKEVRQCLNDAASTVENGSSRKRIQDELTAIESCLSQCEAIADTLKQQ